MIVLACDNRGNLDLFRSSLGCSGRLLIEARAVPAARRRDWRANRIHGWRAHGARSETARLVDRRCTPSLENESRMRQWPLERAPGAAGVRHAATLAMKRPAHISAEVPSRALGRNLTSTEKEGHSWHSWRSSSRQRGSIS